MSAVCRVGDVGTGTCSGHSTTRKITTVFISGANTVYANDLIVCTIGSIGISTCGHQTIAVSGSAFSTALENGIHRVGDVGIVVGAGGETLGSYVAISGSETVISE